MIRLLLDNQSPVNATDIDGWTALHHGMSAPTKKVVQFDHVD